MDGAIGPSRGAFRSNTAATRGDPWGVGYPIGFAI